MKFQIRLYPLIFWVAVVALLPFSCKKEDDLPPPSIDHCEPVEKCFSTTTFAANLYKMEEDVGFAFSIYDGETLVETGQGGLASSPIDPKGKILFDANTTRIHMASVSKSITAIATLQMLRKKDVSLDAKIASWLPSWWVLGENFDKITFRDLLTHRAGIRQLNKEHDFEGLAELSARGVKSEDYGVGWYFNENYSMLRLLIACLDGAKFNQGDALNSQVAGSSYHEFVQKNIMEPLGITNASLLFDSNTSLIFNYPSNNKPGVKTLDNFTNIAGAFGWYLDVVSLGKIFSALSNSEKLLTKAEREMMFDDFLGCYPYGTVGGTAYQHNGYWVWCTPDCGGLTTIWVVFPNNVTAAMVVNGVDTANQGFSPFIGASYITEFVVKAFDHAWE